MPSNKAPAGQVKYLLTENDSGQYVSSVEVLSAGNDDHNVLRYTLDTDDIEAMYLTTQGVWIYSKPIRGVAFQSFIPMHRVVRVGCLKDIPKPKPATIPATLLTNVGGAANSSRANFDL